MLNPINERNNFGVGQFEKNIVRNQSSIFSVFEVLNAIVGSRISQSKTDRLGSQKVGIFRTALAIHRRIHFVNFGLTKIKVSLLWIFQIALSPM